MQIRKPSLDDRTYAIITLPNQLQALLVSDPTTDKAAAALDVNVGHLSDPKDVEGLAHFCEHLLFMGTEKYPGENDYVQFLNSHGGMSNAFTSGDHTNYFFDVAAGFLDPALDRFSQFFIHPLFPDSCNERELLAVDSEHKKNLQSDSWRFYQVLKDLCSDDHPFSGFGTGNIKTLKDIPEKKGLHLRQVLMEFHDKHYSANLMRLVVVGAESIAELTEMVTKHFSTVPNKQIPSPIFDSNPLKPENLSAIVRIKSVKEMRSLYLMFPCIDEMQHYKKHPFQYIAHLIGHEGPGSILSHLKSQGLANQLSAGIAQQGAKGFDFFRISIELTPLGLSNYEEVVYKVFQYIEMLKSIGPVEWVYQECAAIAQMNFRFKEKSSPSSFCSNVARNMHFFDPEHCLDGQYLLEEFDRDLIQNHLEYLNHKNLLVTILASTFVPENWKISEHYGTEYSVEKLSPEFCEKLVKPEMNDNYHLPKLNNLVPDSFMINGTKAETPSKEPRIIYETPVIRLWFKQDDTFMVPKTNFFVELRSNYAYETVEHSVLTRLYIDLLREYINEYSYFAEVAGIAVHLDSSIDGLLLHFSGFNDKLPVLITDIFAKMAEFAIDEPTFVRLKNQLKKSFNGWYFEAPYTHASYYLSFLTQEKLYTTNLKLAALESLTMNDVIQHYRNIISSCHIDLLVHGNSTNEDAIKLAKIVLNTLLPVPPSEPFSELRTRVIPIGKSIIYQANVHDTANVNSAIEFCVQVGSIADPQLRTFTMLISHMAQEPGFNQLRTKEQLGYVVHVGTRKQAEMISLKVIIQSEHDPLYLESRIENFLKLFREIIVSLSDEKFAKYQKSLQVRLNEKLKNLNVESMRYWGDITSRYFDFDQQSRDADRISHITKTELLAFYDRYIAQSSERRKVSVFMTSHKLSKAYNEEQRAQMQSIQSSSIVLLTDNVVQFKDDLPLTTEPMPAQSISNWRQY